jgi:hypothetical protein
VNIKKDEKKGGKKRNNRGHLLFMEMYNTGGGGEEKRGRGRWLLYTPSLHEPGDVEEWCSREVPLCNALCRIG